MKNQKQSSYNPIILSRPNSKDILSGGNITLNKAPKWNPDGSRNMDEYRSSTATAVKNQKQSSGGKPSVGQKRVSGVLVKNPVKDEVKNRYSSINRGGGGGNLSKLVKGATGGDDTYTPPAPKYAKPKTVEVAKPEKKPNMDITQMTSNVNKELKKKKIVKYGS